MSRTKMTFFSMMTIPADSERHLTAANDALSISPRGHDRCFD